jgi:hypothetical protein
MGKGKEGKLRIEHKTLAAHLVQAALRYHNLIVYVSQRIINERDRDQIGKYEKQRDEVLNWARELDPHSIIIYDEYIQRRAHAINAWHR